MIQLNVANVNQINLIVLLQNNKKKLNGSKLKQDVIVQEHLIVSEQDEKN